MARWRFSRGLFGLRTVESDDAGTPALNEYTNPAPAPADFRASERLEVFRQLLRSLDGQTLLDLGAGHGAFSLIGRDLGWEVTAIDARTERYPQEDGVRWIQTDVREVDPTGFDVVCILGLLYHLELDDQLDLFSKCSGQTLIIDTHTAEHPAIDLNGYKGQFFVEETTANTASWDNQLSFWPTEESLVRMLHATGHPLVFKLEPSYYPFRNFYLCPSANTTDATVA
jgi:hypothetical protein